MSLCDLAMCMSVNENRLNLLAQNSVRSSIIGIIKSTALTT